MRSTAMQSTASRRSAANRYPLLPRPEPIVVKAVPSRRKEGEAVAFYKKQLCFFDRESGSVEIGQEYPVMLIKVLWPTIDGRRDFSRIMALLVRVVTDEFTLIQHQGFECSGSMCQTTATGVMPDGDIGPWLTPGRTDVRVAENVNASYNQRPPTPRHPGFAYVNRTKWESGDFPLRIEGVARDEDFMFRHLIKT